MINSKIEQLLAKMTLEEKVAQMLQVSFSPDKKEDALEWVKKGAGSFLSAWGDNAVELQKAALETRLGIPLILGIDAIHGHGCNDHSTIFPSQLTMACSWDTDMAEKVGRATAKEVAADNVHWTFSPVLCLGRDLRWGRVGETFGEDAYLAGELGAAIIKGYQGKNLSDDDAILACAKHYIAYGEAIGGRDAYDTSITWRKLRDVFLPPFKKAIDAGVGSFMTSYGSIDGTPFTTSKKALIEILRDELKYDGFVVTDWNTVNYLLWRQHLCANHGDASRLTAEAGNDMIMTSLEFYNAAIEEVKAGRLDEAVIDTAVRNILNMKDRLGLFEKPIRHLGRGLIGCEEHHKLSLESAKGSIVLLTNNNNTLPLREVKSLAVIGPNADSVRAQYGDWTYFSQPVLIADRPGIRPYVTLKEGLEEACQKRGIKFGYARGCSVTDKDRDNEGQIITKPDETEEFNEAVKLAKSSDVIIYAFGDRKDQAGENHDRANLELSGRQLELFKALKATGKTVIAVFISTKPLCVKKISDNVDAFVCDFSGGQFAGTALAGMIFGEFAPKGRLPIGFPITTGQLPVYYASFPGWHGDRHCDVPAEPLFAFGEGLGYTTFEYSDINVEVKNNETVKATVKVKNTGDSEGIETVQVYFRDLVSSIITPVKRLIGFKQITLSKGEEKTVEFEFGKDSFSLVNVNEETVTEPGEFTLFIGHSSKNNDLVSANFTLK